jgi:hypothetical protein
MSGSSSSWIAPSMSLSSSGTGPVRDQIGMHPATEAIVPPHAAQVGFDDRCRHGDDAPSNLDDAGQSPGHHHCGSPQDPQHGATGGTQCAAQQSAAPESLRETHRGGQHGQSHRTHGGTNNVPHPRRDALLQILGSRRIQELLQLLPGTRRRCRPLFVPALLSAAVLVWSRMRGLLRWLRHDFVVNDEFEFRWFVFFAGFAGCSQVDSTSDSTHAAKDMLEGREGIRL